VKHFASLFISLLVVAGCVSTHESSHPAGPWNMAELEKAPATKWGARSGLVQEVYYQGEPYHGKPTSIFAYLGRPTGKGPYPAVLLVHGGGGKAFRDWAEYWARRGYVALAMDTAGCGPHGPMADGGPDQSDETKFRDFTDGEVSDMWTYQAVAAVIRGHSLLAALPDVDPSRIGIIGLSWGGYLTCIVAGLDHRLKVAVPVYGCGFLGEDSYWKTRALAKMNPEARARWLRDFDPSQYLGGVTCPILFMSGNKDFAYPLDSYRASYRLVPPQLRRVTVIPNLPHTRYVRTFPEIDQFVDSVLRNGTPLPQIRTTAIQGDLVTAVCTFPLIQASLLYTANRGPWHDRQWKEIPLQVTSNTVSVHLPNERPVTWYLLVTDAHGLRVSTDYEEWSSPP
jgi:dienelactone hydrolase